MMSVVRIRVARALSVIAAVTPPLFGAGCADDDRPATEAWTVEWTRERDRVPDAPALLEGGQELCDELVGEFRSVPDRLTPTPSEALDVAVDAWIDHAETIVFECPGDPAEIDRLLEELDVLAAAVDGAITART